MISQDQGQKYLRWSRWAVLVLVLITSLLFSIFFYGAYDGIDFIYLLKLKHYPGDVAHEALLFIIAAVYGYALWGHKRLVPIYVRAFLVVGLAGGLFYVSLEFFGKMQSRAGFVLGCDTDDAYCHVLVSSDFTGAATGFLMLAEVALTLKFGPYISNATQQGALEQGKGPEANHHPAPILVSGQDQYQQQQQPAQLQQYQYQPQFQQPQFQQQPMHFQQPQFQQQSQFQQQPQFQQPPMTYVQPQTIAPQPQSSPPPALNHLTRPQPEGVVSTSP